MALLLSVCVALLWCHPAAAVEGETLHTVRANGALRCGVNEQLAGFAFKDSAGRYQGLNVDLCRAVAAAALNDSEKVKFTPVSSASRFPRLLTGGVDLLAHTITWNLSREVGIGVRYAGVYFYDGQGFVVAKAQGAKSLSDLNQATICVEKSTTHEGNLPAAFAMHGLKYAPRVVETLTAAWASFLAGECSAFTSDRSVLSALVSQTPQGADRFEVLPDLISKEPLGLVVRRGDDQWVLLVRWVLFALIRAEEVGITRANVHNLRDGPSTDMQRRFLTPNGTIATALGVRPDWTSRVVESVGNYGEIYGRSFGDQSRIRLDRGMNRLSADGGLLYAPPFN